MNAPLVSVVVPSYNHRRYVGEALGSALGQSYENIECIVIDDGSSDESYSYIQDTFGADPRVTAISRENRGADATINEGVARARGRYIAILNSDDTYEPQRIETLVNAARASNRPFFGITGVRFVDEWGDRLSGDDPHQRYYDGVCASARDKPAACALWSGNIAITTSNFFFSSDVYRDVGPFRPLRYAHDWDWALRAAKKFDLARIDRELVNYRKHGANTIDEAAPWRRLLEDAYVWAAALRDGAPRAAANDNPRLYFASMLENGGVPLVPLFYMLASAKTDAELLDAIADGSLRRELEAVRPGGSGDFAESLGAIVHGVGRLREEKGALEAEVARLKDTIAQLSAGAPASARPARAAKGGLWSRLFGRARAVAPPPSPQEIAGPPQIDIAELGPARDAATLLYAEGQGLTRIHLYRTPARFVLATYAFNPALRRSFLISAAAGRSMPLRFLMRGMTLKPERCDPDFVTRLSARGLAFSSAPFDHALAAGLPPRGVYGETLETLLREADAADLVAQPLDAVDPARVVAALARHDLMVAAPGGDVAMTYAGFDEGGDIRIGVARAQELRPSQAPLRITAIKPA